MKKYNVKSITSRVTIGILFLIFIQSIFLLCMISCSGILEKMKQTERQSFYQIVHNRAGYLQNEMQNRWSNISSYADSIAEFLPLLDNPENSYAENTTAFFLHAETSMISMLRTAGVNDCFLILNNKTNGSQAYPALYFRDEDPLLNSSSYEDVLLISGPTTLSVPYQTYEDLWGYQLTLKEENQEFFMKPFSRSGLSNTSSQLGYWSMPFSLFENDTQIMTYSMPLKSSEGKVYGVIGIGLFVTYLNSCLPAYELSAKDSPGYLLAAFDSTAHILTPILYTGAYQRRMLESDSPLCLEEIDSENQIYLLENKGNRIYTCLEKLQLYPENTPFADEILYLAAFKEESKLYSLPYQFENILFYSILSSILLSTLLTVILCRGITVPIVTLSRRVLHINPLEDFSLGKYNLSELDELAKAIEDGNRNMRETSLKISQAVDMADIPIGVFQYKDRIPQVLATSRVETLLSLSPAEAVRLFQNHILFEEKLRSIMENPFKKNEQIFALSSNPPKWIKINLVNKDAETLGIVLDVTEEILEAERLKKERDYDALTQLCGRRFFQKRVAALLEQEDLQAAAMVMFDIDDFKDINDNYGHACGDTYLQEAANYLKKISQDNCIVGRRSGDEFFAFFYDFSSKEEILKRLRFFYQLLKSQPYILPNGEKRILSISAGVAFCNGKKQSYESLLADADSALYRVKNESKGYFGINP